MGLVCLQPLHVLHIRRAMIAETGYTTTDSRTIGDQAKALCDLLTRYPADRFTRVADLSRELIEIDPGFSPFLGKRAGLHVIWQNPKILLVAGDLPKKKIYNEAKAVELIMSKEDGRPYLPKDILPFVKNRSDIPQTT